jgi:hypothetical protein
MPTNEIRALTGKILRLTQWINRYSNHLQEFSKISQNELDILKERISQKEIEISWQKYLNCFSETRRLREVGIRERRLKESNLSQGDKNFYKNSHLTLIKQLNDITTESVWKETNQEEINNFEEVVIELNKAIINIRNVKNEFSGLTEKGEDPDTLFIKKLKKDILYINEEIDYLCKEYNIVLSKVGEY